MSEIVQPRRFCGVLCISRSTCTYTYTATAEKARQLHMYAQLTRCFSAVAELLVLFVLLVILSVYIYLFSQGIKELSVSAHEEFV